MKIDQPSVEAAIAKLNKVYPRPGIGPLELSPPYVIDVQYPDDYWPHRRDWGQGPGGAGVAGVYFFFDKSGSLLYVGKATCLATRLSQYFRIGPDKKAVPTSDKSEGVSLVRVISLPPGHGFEASAIESFLIQELSPPRNDRT